MDDFESNAGLCMGCAGLCMPGLTHSGLAPENFITLAAPLSLLGDELREIGGRAPNR